MPPRERRRVAERMPTNFPNDQSVDPLMPREVAAIIAGKLFRQILVQEAELKRLALGRSS
jgi:hypothetical protein